MARLRNIHTEAVVSVSDETAAQLGGEWESIPAESTTAKAAAKPKAPTRRKS